MWARSDRLSNSRTYGVHIGSSIGELPQELMSDGGPHECVAEEFQTIVVEDPFVVFTGCFHALTKKLQPLRV